MKVYLASRYSRHEELQEYAKILTGMGYQVTSRWIWGDHQIDDNGLSIEAKKQERERLASEDWADLNSADMCISFTEKPRSCNSRGGRHVEFGIALALQQACFVVGPRENVFHCLPGVDVFNTFDDLVAALTPPTDKEG